MPHLTKDEFTLELGWGVGAAPSRRHWLDVREALDASEGCMRISTLLEPRVPERWWTVLVDQAWLDTLQRFSSPGKQTLQDLVRLEADDALGFYVDRAVAGPTDEDLQAAIERIPSLVKEALDAWEAHAEPWLAAKAQRTDR